VRAVEVPKRSPGFSVVIPLYNKEPHVARAISSVLAQTLEDFEIIVVNDASTDNSEFEVQKFGDARIRILQRGAPGPGGYAARNLGITHAQGEWVAFLDADDEWEGQHLQNVKGAITANPALEVISCGWKISDGQMTSYDAYSKMNWEKGGHYFDVLDFVRRPVPIWTSVASVKKSVLETAGGFDERWRHGADLELWLRLLLEHKALALWQPYIGATYHIDSINRVTKTQRQEYSPVTSRIKEYIALPGVGNPHVVKVLETAVNKAALKFSKRRVARTRLDLQYVKAITCWESLGSSQKLAWRVIVLMPWKIQRAVFGVG
jgi:glycosyltransferase involved in cell wall biosynthesis